jgi:hypothetical protein
MVVATGPGRNDDVGADAGGAAVTAEVEAGPVVAGAGVIAGAEVLDPTATVESVGVVPVAECLEDEPHPVTANTITTPPTTTARKGHMLPPITRVLSCQTTPSDAHWARFVPGSNENAAWPATRQQPVCE